MMRRSEGKIRPEGVIVSPYRIWRICFLGLFLIAITIIVYIPVLHAGFVWDDDDHLTRNPCIVGPLGLADIWTSSRAVYYPLVLTSFWVLHKFVGLNPLPYHLLNVLLHAGCAVLLWRALHRLDLRGAWLGAALWALHPVMVQSVAWITELKNTQSCLFYLLSILFFLKADDAGGNAARRRLHGGLSFLFFVMAIASKPSAVMLPVVLVLCLWWRKDRLRRRDLLPLAPFFLLSVAASVWTIWEQKFHSGALGTEWVQTWAQRLAIAGCDIWFYLGKLVWPDPLIFIYPRWKIDIVHLPALLPLLAAAGGLVFLWWKRNGPLRPVFFAAAYFAVSLLPVLGFFNVYFFRYSFVSDHFQYLASIGPLALAASGIATGLGFAGKAKSWLQPAISGALLLTLGTCTWRQTQHYSSAEILYRATIEQNPDCWLAHSNLAGDLLERGEVDEAIAHFEKAVEIWPGHAEAHNNLGNALVRKGATKEAIVHFQKVLEIWPNDVEARNNLGGALLEEGRVDEAIAQFERVLAEKPDHAQAHNNLGNALLQKGRIDEAIAHYQRTLELPFDHGGSHYNLGNAFLQKGEIDEAITHYRKALELRPNHPNTYNNLGNALRHRGLMAEAIFQYQRAAEMEPNSALIQNNLAWVLATCAQESLRNGAKAIESAERANQLSGGGNPIVLHTLAAASAERGEFSRALDTAQRALELADAQGNTSLADSIRREITLYRAGLPYHEGPK